MGRKHEGLLMILFPNQEGTGIDLGNVELKETTTGKEMFSLMPKDMQAEYFLFYSNLQERFWFVDSQDIPAINKRRSFRVAQIERVVLWTTKDVVEVIERLRPYINNQKYLQVLS